MQAVTTIRLDIAKSVFQIHGVDAAGNVIVLPELRIAMVADKTQPLQLRRLPRRELELKPARSGHRHLPMPSPLRGRVK